MLYLRSCPHCRVGAVEVDYVAASAQFRCLNCGWRLDLDGAGRLASEAAKDGASRKPSPAA